MVIIMQNSDVFEKDRKYIAHIYHRFPAAIKNGHGAQAEDYEGKKYIDFGSGIGTNSLGLCNSKWVQAVVSQVSQLQHTSNLFYTLLDSLLAERLCEVTEYSKVFFGNSGAEANEGAIKVARKYGMKVKGGALQPYYYTGKFLSWKDGYNAFRHRSGYIPLAFFPFYRRFSLCPGKQQSCAA